MREYARTNQINPGGNYAFFREPIGAFFTFVFPLILLFLFGSVWGNKPTPFFGGFGYVDILVPAYTSALIATNGLMTLAITKAVYCEYKILRRFQATPIKPIIVLTAQVIMLFAMTILGTGLMIVVVKIVYGLRFAGIVFYLFAGYLLSCQSLFSLGSVIAGLLPTARTAQIVAMALFYPMLFLSGATIPRQILPLSVRKVAKVQPLTHVVNLLRGLWVGENWNKHITSVSFLLIPLIICITISAKTFRWE
ncbi:MAG: ABC transporter permease [candidate division WOR-3 bacterium]|nr:ABC transporter permease [candidate division WOR-3 bacterium]